MGKGGEKKTGLGGGGGAKVGEPGKTRQQVF